MFSVLVSACAAQPSPKPAESNNLPASVGVAKMLPDGTLQLFLMGKIGNANAEKFIEVKKGEEKYESYISHIGGIKPGEVKSIPPWQKGKD